MSQIMSDRVLAEMDKIRETVYKSITVELTITSGQLEMLKLKSSSEFDYCVRVAIILKDNGFEIDQIIGHTQTKGVDIKLKYQYEVEYCADGSLRFTQTIPAGVCRVRKG